MLFVSYSLVLLSNSVTPDLITHPQTWPLCGMHGNKKPLKLLVFCSPWSSFTCSSSSSNFFSPPLNSVKTVQTQQIWGDRPMNLLSVCSQQKEVKQEKNSNLKKKILLKDIKIYKLVQKINQKSSCYIEITKTEYYTAQW